MNEIISNVIISFISLIGTVITVAVGNKSTQKLVDYRLDELSRKVEKHNKVVERTFQLEEDSKSVKMNINELKEDVDILKNDVNSIKTDIAIIKAKGE